MTHTHLIAPKDKDFLKQERKDPITGDKITVGDEVVFCASCKSVFLKGTWEYLGGQHCEQTKTLKSIPSSLPQVEMKERNLFRKSTIDNTLTFRRSSKPYWENKTIGKQLLIDEKVVGFLMLSMLFLGLCIAGYYMLIEEEKISFLILSILNLLSTVPLLYKSLVNKKANRSEDKNEDSFYISRSGLGLTSKFGYHYFLPTEHIDKIVVNGNAGFLDQYAQISIYYGGSRRDKSRKVKVKLGETITVEELEVLVRSLQIVSSSRNIPVEMRFKSEYKQGLVQNILSEYPSSKSSILLLEM